jgi:NadR type nicotinamide-nucleotide adenylyltransferase
VCVTGPESTGKTTLARNLAEWAGAAWVPEASREHALRKGGDLDVTDVGPIGRRHVTAADEAAERACEGGAPLLVLDTDLLSTVVYARHYYGVVPRWIERAEPRRRADLYLLCDVDVPWIADGVRDRPLNREAMFDLFHRALSRRRAPTVVVRGDWSARWQIARDAVECLRGGRPG